MIKVNGGRCEASGTLIEIMTDVVVTLEMSVVTLSHKKEDVNKEEIIYGIISTAIKDMNERGEKIDQAKIGLAMIAKAEEARHGR